MAPPGSGSGDARLTTLLGPVVEESGHVLEGVTTTPAGRRRVVRVVVDLPAERTGSVDLDAVALVARAVSDTLDGPDGSRLLGGTPYVLEVTSPGVDRPLTERRHWSRARGRLVTVPVEGSVDGGPDQVLTGRVGTVDDDGVVLAVGGAAGGEPVDRLVAWAELGTGRVQVEFSRPDDADDADGADGADDADGADEGED